LSVRRLPEQIACLPPAQADSAYAAMLPCL